MLEKTLATIVVSSYLHNEKRYLIELDILVNAWTNIWPMFSTFYYRNLQFVMTTNCLKHEA